jgi:polyphenol oxidase
VSLLIHSQLLASTGQVVEGISTSKVGNLAYKYGEPEQVTKSRRLLARELGVQLSHGVFFRPLNRDIIVDVDAGFSGVGMAGGLPVMADAVVTKTPGVGLMVLLADCQSVSLFDPVAMVVALIHAGRRSLQEQLVAKCIDHLRHHYGTDPENLLAYLGPSISPQHHVFEPWITEEATGWGKHMSVTSTGHYALDIQGYSIEQLRLGGVRVKNIEAAGIDTYSSPQFFSHVRSSHQGAPEERFGVYLGLRADATE